MARALRRVRDVGVGHRRVLAEHVHPPDLAAIGAVDDLDDREAGRRVDLGAPPDVAEEVAHLGVGHGLIIRHDLRDEACVRRALHVVLTAQRMQAGTRPADVTAEQRERDQAARVVGAVDVLRDAHAPEDHRPRAHRRRPAPPRGSSRRRCRRARPCGPGVKARMWSRNSKKPSVKPSMYCRS